MFIIIYKKSTKHIMSYRHDSSTGLVNTAEYYFNLYLKDNNLTPDQALDLTYIETAPIVLSLQIGKHLWNELTQQVEEDSSYVAPTPTST